MIENGIFKEKNLPAKKRFKISIFLPLVKSKNEHQSFKKHQKHLRCPIRRLNFCDYSKKSCKQGKKMKTKKKS